MSKGEGIRRVSHGYHYFLVKPGTEGDVHSSARRIMGMERIREVVVTEGEYGFVVRADDACKAKITAATICRMVGGEISSVTGHYSYVRRTDKRSKKNAPSGRQVTPRASGSS